MPMSLPTSPQWPRRSPRSMTFPRRTHRRHGLTKRRPTLPDQPIVPQWTRHPDEWAKAFHALAVERPGSAQVFLHGDFHPANVLFDTDGVLTGVVDWSAASVGAPEFD